MFLGVLDRTAGDEAGWFDETLSEIRITSSTSGFARQAEPFGLTRRPLLSTNPVVIAEKLPVNISITGVIRLAVDDGRVSEDSTVSSTCCDCRTGASVVAKPWVLLALLLPLTLRLRQG